MKLISDLTYIACHVNHKPHFTNRSIFRSRQTGETVADFVADLRHLAAHCKSGDMLETTLRYRTILCVESITLAFETDLTFEQAFAIAKGSAEADKNVKELENPRTNPSRVTVKPEPVNKVQSKSEKLRSRRRPKIPNREPDSQNSNIRVKSLWSH